MKDDRCTRDVADGGGSVGFHRCGNKAVRDGLCRIHLPEAAAARTAKSEAHYASRRREDEERRERSHRRWLRERLIAADERDREELYERLTGEKWSA